MDLEWMWSFAKLIGRQKHFWKYSADKATEEGSALRKGQKKKCYDELNLTLSMGLAMVTGLLLQP